MHNSQCSIGFFTVVKVCVDRNTDFGKPVQKRDLVYHCTVQYILRIIRPLRQLLLSLHHYRFYHLTTFPLIIYSYFIYHQYSILSVLFEFQWMQRKKRGQPKLSTTYFKHMFILTVVCELSESQAVEWGRSVMCSLSTTSENYDFHRVQCTKSGS